MLRKSSGKGWRPLSRTTTGLGIKDATTGVKVTSSTTRTICNIYFLFSRFPIALKLLLGLMIYVTFALNFWFPFDLMWYYIKRKYDPSKYWLWERVYRTIFICVITAIATTFPNVSKFIGVVLLNLILIQHLLI